MKRKILFSHRAKLITLHAMESVKNENQIVNYNRRDESLAEPDGHEKQLSFW